MIDITDCIVCGGALPDDCEKMHPKCAIESAGEDQALLKFSKKLKEINDD